MFMGQVENSEGYWILNLVPSYLPIVESKERPPGLSLSSASSGKLSLITVCGTKNLGTQEVSTASFLPTVQPLSVSHSAEGTR